MAESLTHSPQRPDGPVWLFGYGSLIYKVDFPYIECSPAHIVGWKRRFWQGSHDHRGTPQAPGRVLTLVRSPGQRCGGMAYLVAPEVFKHLDVREKNGYLRLSIPLYLANGSQHQGLVYLATEENEAWLGPAPDTELAAHIARSHGPSGPNREYLLHLADALRNMNEHDDHVFALERELLALELEQSQS
ncbi:gamma-glutamylcyclotransferase [Oleiagrimonas sp. C23AA]|uniref:gamma-glutamylcyclotransferase n=1 Tax=Oleiagrimonas sp. C23AA TaxID=2719047 RepID=UPI0031B6824A